MADLTAIYRKGAGATLKDMDSSCRSQKNLSKLFALSASLLGLLLSIGCASPGPPRAPSLNLPQPVSDLTANRIGNVVELHFTVPHLSTDKTPLYDPRHHRTAIRGILCREVDHRDCNTVASLQPPLTSATHISFTFKDELPLLLTTGSPRLIGYRIEFFNDLGSSAGKSQAAFTASGPAPTPVSALQAEGTRQGVLLRWTAVHNPSDEVLLHRLALAPKPILQPKSGAPVKPSAHFSGTATKHDDRDDATWLASNSAEGRTLDSTVIAGEPYRYTAVRRRLVTLDTRTFDVRSVPSAPVDFTLSEGYPPDTPTALTAVGFQPPPTPGTTEILHFAVDLIWQPVDNSVDAKIAAPIAGYNIYRETLDAQGHPGPRTRLNSAPVPIPGYHDTTADASTRYRYAVTAVDAKGNESATATVTLEPSPE